MISAVDYECPSLICFRHGLAKPGTQSRDRLLGMPTTEGAVVVCDIVYAELVPAFAERTALDRALRGIGATLSPISSSIAYEAGLRWKQYRAAGGPRNRIIADFLIGAHALAAADTFLTRDRGFYATYFPELRHS